MKLTNKLPFLCFIAIFIILYFDKHQYSNLALLLILSLLFVSIISYILSIRQNIKDKNFNKNRFILFAISLSVSVTLFIYQFLNK